MSKAEGADSQWTWDVGIPEHLNLHSFLDLRKEAAVDIITVLAIATPTMEPKDAIFLSHTRI